MPITNNVTVGFESWFDGTFVAPGATAIDHPASQSHPDHPPQNAVNDNTFDSWWFNHLKANRGAFNILEAQYITPTVAANSLCYVAIVNHDLATVIPTRGCDIDLDYYDAGWSVVDINPASGQILHPVTSNETTGVLFDSPSEDADRFRVHFHNSASPESDAGDSVYARMGICKMGRALDLTRPAYRGYEPLRYRADLDIRPRMSSTGEYLGKTVRRRGRRGSLRIDEVERSFVMSAAFEKFYEHSLTRPFFLWWKPLDYPNEVEFVWLRRPMRLRQRGPRRLVSLRFDLQGYGRDFVPGAIA